MIPGLFKLEWYDGVSSGYAQNILLFRGGDWRQTNDKGVGYKQNTFYKDSGGGLTTVPLVVYRRIGHTSLII